MIWIVAAGAIAGTIFLINTICDEMRRADNRDEDR